MAFAWSEVGAGPGTDEIEISVFGPGFGECVVGHVGGGNWFVVDSCIDPSDRIDRRPVAERYLRAIGVALETQVKVVVASHWDDDHVRGLSRLVELCTASRFVCANALLEREFIAFVEEIGTGSAATDGAKVREFRQVLRILSADQSRPKIRHAAASREVAIWAEGTLPHGQRCSLRSLSPSDLEYDLFLSRIAAETVQHGQPKRSVATKPNHASVVLHMEAGSCSVLLGADMELHHDIRRGWNAVIDEAKESGSMPASLYKVAHHGSSNGHHDLIWPLLLAPAPIAIVSPFNRLPLEKKLPTLTDINRIRNFGGRVFVTSQANAGGRGRGRERAVDRSLEENGITLRSLETPVGMVRARGRIGSTESWRIDAFPPAAEVT